MDLVGSELSARLPSSALKNMYLSKQKQIISIIYRIPRDMAQRWASELQLQDRGELGVGIREDSVQAGEVKPLLPCSPLPDSALSLSS